MVLKCLFGGEKTFLFNRICAIVSASSGGFDIDVRFMKDKLPKIFFALGVGVAIVIVLVLGLSQLKKHLSKNALDNLTTVNHNVRQALHRQINSEVNAITQIIENGEIRTALVDMLINEWPSRDDRFMLRRILARSVFSQHYNGFYLIGKNRQVIVSMKERVGGQHVPNAVVLSIKRLEQGEQSAITPYFDFGGKTSMWLLKAIANEKGVNIGYFALDLGSEHHFSTTTVSSGFSYMSGETYLVDEQGVMITESRFQEQLINIGLLKHGESSASNIKVLDPGVNLLEQPTSIKPSNEQPFTLAVEQALAQHQLAWNTDGYRDYRGVSVLGVWQWDKYLSVAIITEIDQEEAMQLYLYVRNMLLILLFFVLSGSVMMMMAYSRLRIRSEQEANKHKNLLLESTAESIYGVDVNGDCTFVNRSFLDVLGYEESEVIGQNIHQLIHYAYPDGAVYPVGDCNIYRSHIECIRIHRSDESFWHKDGHEIMVEYWSQPLFEGDEVVGSIVTFLDITQQRKNEHERAQLEKQVEHTQRLESLGVLAGGIAHDFNNLLAAILGNASLAESNMLKNPLEAKERIAKVILATEKAGVLCKQMLAYSGKGQFILKPIDLSDIVREMTHLLEVSIDKSVIVKYQLTKALPLIMVDEAQIQQVIMNLVTNANEAVAGRNGVVSLTTGMMHADEAYLANCFSEHVQAGCFIYVEVSDTGCGMDNTTIQKIFDPFFSTKLTGRGLGMSAVLGIVRGHKGALKVCSELDRGTTFRFLLPVDESEKTLALDHAPQTTELVHFSGGTVLVVDDEETVREVSCMILQEMGFKTITASNGEEGLAMYREHQQDVLFVLSDLTMPRMCGKELFTALKGINPECRVILSSGYNSTDAIQQFSGKGLAGFIQKPFTPHELSDEIKKMLGGPE